MQYYYPSLTNISDHKMSSGGGGEGGPHLRRLREDLHEVVRSSLTPLMETPGTSSSVPSSLATHLGHSQAGSVQTSATSWQENITVTVQPQLLTPRQCSPLPLVQVQRGSALFGPEPQSVACASSLMP